MAAETESSLVSLFQLHEGRIVTASNNQLTRSFMAFSMGGAAATGGPRRVLGQRRPRAGHADSYRSTSATAACRPHADRPRRGMLLFLAGLRRARQSIATRKWTTG